MSRKFANAAKDALNRDYGYEKTYKSGNNGKLSFSTPYNIWAYDDRTKIPYKATFCAAKEYADGGRRRQKVQRCHK